MIWLHVQRQDGCKCKDLCNRRRPKCNFFRETLRYMVFDRHRAVQSGSQLSARMTMMNNERVAIPCISTKNKKFAVTVTLYQNNRDSVVRITGVEPARGIPPDPKSGASANSAISAYVFWCLQDCAHRQEILQKNPQNKLRVGADDEARTRYLHLGKVALYQMSYIRNCKKYFSRFIALCQAFLKKFFAFFVESKFPK